MCIVDHNKIGSIDFIKNMPSIGILEKKISAFGWEVVSIDGHSHKNILETYKFVTNSTDQRPKMIIANTIKGKGISFMENDPIWHAKQLNEEELIKIAYKELAIEHGK